MPELSEAMGGAVAVSDDRRGYRRGVGVMANPSLSGRGQALKKGRKVPKLRFNRGR